MKDSRKIWGIVFILAAVYVVVGRFWDFPYVGIFRIMATVVLLWAVVDGVRKVNFYEILIPIAVLCILYRRFLGFSVLTPWTLLWAAVLGSVGLNMIFGGRRRSWRREGYDIPGNMNDGDGRAYTGREIRIENTFSTAIRYINSENFQMARIENTFGTLSVYLDNAIVPDNNAYLELNNHFGLTNLFIPNEWKVREDIDRAFGSVNEAGENTGTSAVNLSIHGASNFGTVRIYYI